MSSTPPDRFPMELDEFCCHLSRTDRRVALIGAFHFAMKRKGLKVASEEEWRDEFFLLTGRVAQ